MLYVVTKLENQILHNTKYETFQSLDNGIFHCGFSSGTQGTTHVEHPSEIVFLVWAQAG